MMGLGCDLLDLCLAICVFSFSFSQLSKIDLRIEREFRRDHPF